MDIRIGVRAFFKSSPASFTHDAIVDDVTAFYFSKIGAIPPHCGRLLGVVWRAPDVVAMMQWPVWSW